MGRADESLRHGMYERILERMLRRYRASSAWCFSRAAGMFDEYIIDQDDYVGVGSGAFSYVGGAMYSTTFSLNHYCRRIEGGQRGITQRRVLGAKERMRYDFLVRLFGGELRHDWVERRYGRRSGGAWRPSCRDAAVGATRHDADAIRLTRTGMYCWVLMMAEFFNAVNDVREQMREHIRAELEAWNEDAGAALGRRRAMRARCDREHAGHARFPGPRQRRALHARADTRGLRAPPRQPAARHRHGCRDAALGRGRGRARLHDRQLHRAADRVPGRQHRLARRARHDQRPRGGRCDPEVPEPRRAARGGPRVRGARARGRRHRGGGR